MSVKETRAQEIADLSELVEFLEKNPEIPMPYFGQVNTFAYQDIDPDVNVLARIMAPCEKSASTGYYTLTRSFGSIDLWLNFDREQVCERIVTGIREVPEKIVEAHSEEIIEWHCPDGILRSA